MKSLQKAIFFVFCFTICFTLINGQVNSGDGSLLDPCVNYGGTEQSDCLVCDGSNSDCPKNLDSCYADTNGDYFKIMQSLDRTNCYVICTAPVGIGESIGAAVVCGNSISEYMSPRSQSYHASNYFADAGDCDCQGALNAEDVTIVESQQQSIVGGGYVYQGPYPWSTLSGGHHKDVTLNSWSPSFAGRSPQYFINHVSYQYLKSNALREISWPSVDNPVNNWFFKWTGGSLSQASNRNSLTSSWEPTTIDDKQFKAFDLRANPDAENQADRWTDWTPVAKGDVHYAGSPPVWFPSTSQPVPTGFMVIVPADEVWIWVVDGFGFCISGFAKTSSNSWDPQDNLLNCGLNAKNWGYGEFPRAELWQEAPMLIKSEIRYDPGPQKVKYWNAMYALSQPGNGKNAGACIDGGEFGSDVFLSCDFKTLSHFIAPTNCLSGFTYSKNTQGFSYENSGYSPCWDRADTSGILDLLLDQFQPDGSGEKWENGDSNVNDLQITRDCPQCTEINKNTNDYYVSLGSSGINIGVNYTFYKYGSACKNNQDCPPSPFGGIANGCLFVKGVMFDCNECVIDECNPGTYRPLDSCDCIPCTGDLDADGKPWKNRCFEPTPNWDSTTCSCVGCIEDEYKTTLPDGTPLPVCTGGFCYDQDPNDPCEIAKCEIWSDSCEYGRVDSCSELDDKCCPCKECTVENYEEFKPASCTGDNLEWRNDCTCSRCAYSQSDSVKPDWPANDPRWCQDGEQCTAPVSCKPAECGNQFEPQNAECGSHYYDPDDADDTCNCKPCADSWPAEGTVDTDTGRLSDGSCAEGWYLPDEWVGQDCRPCRQCDECPPGTQPVGYKQSPPVDEQLDIFIYVD